MATCKNCGKPLILQGGRCIYCQFPADSYLRGALQKCARENGNDFKQQPKQIVTSPSKTDVVLKQYNGHPYIDLGLPSGLKWATCNVGAMNPWEYGGYYAWGEIEEKDVYNQESYKYSWPRRYSKYANDAFCEVIDNKWTLEQKDDVAHVKWGGDWRMPTVKEYEELINSCHNEWVCMNNVKGLKLISKNNGGSIFFPASGLRMDRDIVNKDIGYYKSSTLYENNSEGAYVFLFLIDKLSGQSEIHIHSNLRDLGQSVRPVFK